MSGLDEPSLYAAYGITDIYERARTLATKSRRSAAEAAELEACQRVLGHAVLDVAEDHIIAHWAQQGLFDQQGDVGLVGLGGTFLKKAQDGPTGRISFDFDVRCRSYEATQTFLAAIQRGSIGPFTYRLTTPRRGKPRLSVEDAVFTFAQPRRRIINVDAVHREAMLPPTYRETIPMQAAHLYDIAPTTSVVTVSVVEDMAWKYRRMHTSVDRMLTRDIYDTGAQASALTPHLDILPALVTLSTIQYGTPALRQHDDGTLDFRQPLDRRAIAAAVDDQNANPKRPPICFVPPGDREHVDRRILDAANASQTLSNRLLASIIDDDTLRQACLHPRTHGRQVERDIKDRIAEHVEQGRATRDHRCLTNDDRQSPSKGPSR